MAGKIKMAGKGLKAIGLAKLPQGKHYDGGGLILNVEASGSRSWTFRTMIKGKRREIGLGGLSYVSLADAREKAAELRAKARKGEDIVEARKAEKAAQEHADSVPSFEAAAAIVHKSLAETFKSEDHAYNWLQSLKTYVFPVFGLKTVDKIDSADVLTAIGPIWTSKADTAGRTLRRVKAVFDWCIVKGFRTVDVNGMKVTMPNPCDAIRAALPKRNGAVQHHEALDFKALPEFIRALRTSQSALSVKLALEFTILTAARTREVLDATWEEIDFESKTWSIPAARMKMKEPHKVPLSVRAVEILELARQFNDAKVIFPGRYAGRPLSNMSMLMLLRRMGHELHTHGFRATFKTWAEETTKHDHLVIEAALAHAVKGIERHYLRTTFFEKRRELMDSWARFATAAPTAKVVSIGRTVRNR